MVFGQIPIKKYCLLSFYGIKSVNFGLHFAVAPHPVFPPQIRLFTIQIFSHLLHIQ